MRYFFIDLENVRNEGLEGVLSLDSDDVVLIYYSDNAMNLSIPTMQNMTGSKATSKFIKTNYIGKNAMDFQIVSLFGAMIERNKEGHYYIISQDNGFRSAVSFCESYFEDYDIHCGVFPTIISAITDELKWSVSSKGKAKKAKTNAKTNETDAAHVAEAENKNGRQSDEKTEKVSKRKKKANADDKRMSREESSTEGAAKGKAVVKDTVNDTVTDATEQGIGDECEALSDNTSENSSEAEPKKRKRKRRRKKNTAAQTMDVAVNSTNETTDSVESQSGSVESQADSADGRSDGELNTAEAETLSPEKALEQKRRRLGYIYETLGELLSERTIDIYAEGIDKGVAECKNKKELHEFFRTVYGGDEAEAIYRVMQGDFEIMKQKRPAESEDESQKSHSHRRRRRRK